MENWLVIPTAQTPGAASNRGEASPCFKRNTTKANHRGIKLIPKKISKKICVTQKLLIHLRNLKVTHYAKRN